MFVQTSCAYLIRKQQNPVNSIQFDSLGEVIVTETCIPSSV